MLGEQNCTITVRQIGGYLFFTLWLDDTLIAENAIILPSVYTLQSKAAAFSGNFLMLDTKDAEQRDTPAWSGLGDRWRLYWLSPETMAELAGAAQ